MRNWQSDVSALMNLVEGFHKFVGVSLINIQPENSHWIVDEMVIR